MAVITGAWAGVMTPIPGDPVSIDSGKLAGTMLESGVKAYFGIPFAAPPVRELRWHAPMPPKHWNGIYTADQKRAECVQGLRSSSINHYFGEEDAAEDCLYLNIWEPGDARPGARLPVVVWIYGGGFMGGSASSPIYSGEPLARKGVVYVAMNYRLGIFGFLAHPQLTAESGHHASGDWGFLDQVAALQWIHRNIAALGGNPDNVTLVGQSAGSMSITNLQASPLTHGLFQRAFGMSGTTLKGGAGAGVPLAEAEAQGVKLQVAMNAMNLLQMRASSSDKVSFIAQQSQLRVGPDIDGYFLPETTDAIFAAGRQNDMPLVTGSTANDIGTAVPVRAATTLAEYTELANKMYGDNAAAFLRLYPASDDAEARRQAEEVGRNSGFAIGARNWARAQTLTGKQPAYLFMVAKVQPFAAGIMFSDFDPATAGAYHMCDVPYFLGTYEAFNLFRTTRNWTANDRELSDRMQDVIVHFAMTGDPSTAAVRFVRYDPRNEMRVTFGETIGLEKIYGRGMDFIELTPATIAPRAPRTAPGASGTGPGERGPAGGPPSPAF
jgi:para-nitrobenzyl esterase